MCKASGYFKCILIFAFAVSGCVLSATFISLTGVTVNFKSSSVWFKICGITVGIKKSKSIINEKKKKKGNKKVILVKTKLFQLIMN